MKLKCYIVSIVLFFAAAAPATAQDLFMKIQEPGAPPGESVAAAFPGWSEITDLNAGASAELPVGWNGGGAVTTKCFTISMALDRVGYYLKRKMYQRVLIRNMQIDITKQTGQGLQTYYSIALEDVYVTLVEEGVNEEGRTTLNVSFVPEKFRYTYYPQNSNGSLGTPVVFGWNQRMNVAW